MIKTQSKKLISIAILIVLYILLVLNIHKIRFGLDILRLYVQDENIESHDDSIFNSKLPKDNPLKDMLCSIEHIDNIVEIQDNKMGNENHSLDKVDTSMNTIKPEDKNIKASKEPVNSIDDKKSYISIITEYNLIFEELKTEFESELDSLIQKGIDEYSKDKVSNVKLANKYLSIGSKLEKSSDARFNQLLKNLKKDLKDNKHDTTISKKIKDYYESFKEDKKTELIDRGMKHLD